MATLTPLPPWLAGKPPPPTPPPPTPDIFEAEGIAAFEEELIGEIDQLLNKDPKRLRCRECRKERKKVRKENVQPVLQSTVKMPQQKKQKKKKKTTKREWKSQFKVRMEKAFKHRAKIIRQRAVDTFKASGSGKKWVAEETKILCTKIQKQMAAKQLHQQLHHHVPRRINRIRMAERRTKQSCKQTRRRQREAKLNLKRREEKQQRLHGKKAEEAKADAAELDELNAKDI